MAIDPANQSEIVLELDSGNIDLSLNGGTTWSGVDWSNSYSSTDIPWLANANTNGYMGVGGEAFNPLNPNEIIDAAGVGVWTTTISSPSTFTWQTPVVWNDKSVGIEQLVANDIIVPPVAPRLLRFGTEASLI